MLPKNSKEGNIVMALFCLRDANPCVFTAAAGKGGKAAFRGET